MPIHISIVRICFAMTPASSLPEIGIIIHRNVYIVNRLNGKIFHRKFAASWIAAIQITYSTVCSGVFLVIWLYRSTASRRAGSPIP